tara:strand:- start:78 stop:491 length:414 start_codon:yes stop_codon:yes gene_type:complete
LLFLERATRFATCTEEEISVYFLPPSVAVNVFPLNSGGDLAFDSFIRFTEKRRKRVGCKKVTDDCNHQADLKIKMNFSCEGEQITAWRHWFCNMTNYPNIFLTYLESKEKRILHIFRAAPNLRDQWSGYLFGFIGFR